MPPPPGTELGPPPPPAPRVLPQKFVFRTLCSRNFGFLFGAIFGGVGSVMMIPMMLTGMWLPALFPALFVIGGFSVLKYGLNQGRNTIQAFSKGESVKGTVASLELDTTQSINGKHPWKLLYHFPVNDQLHEGKVVSFDSTMATRRIGQPLWVLYLPSDPEKNTLYPPLR